MAPIRAIQTFHSSFLLVLFKICFFFFLCTINNQNTSNVPIEYNAVACALRLNCQKIEQQQQETTTEIDVRISKCTVNRNCQIPCVSLSVRMLRLYACVRHRTEPIIYERYTY